jgi:uncharacterized membrane protein
MTDWQLAAAILAVGAASYAMRAGGFLAAGLIDEASLAGRILRLLPSNMLVAFVAAGAWSAGWASAAGCAAGILAMALTRREWAALAAGFAAALLVAWLRG